MLLKSVEDSKKYMEARFQINVAEGEARKLRDELEQAERNQRDSERRLEEETQRQRKIFDDEKKLLADKALEKEKNIAAEKQQTIEYLQELKKDAEEREKKLAQQFEDEKNRLQRDHTEARAAHEAETTKKLREAEGSAAEQTQIRQSMERNWEKKEQNYQQIADSKVQEFDRKIREETEKVENAEIRAKQRETELKQEHERLMADQREKTKHLKEASDEKIQSLIAEHKTERLRENENINALKSKIDRLEEDKSTLQSTVTSLNIDKGRLEGKLDYLEKDKVGLRSEVRTLIVQTQDQREGIGALKSENQALKNKNSELININAEYYGFIDDADKLKSGGYGLGRVAGWNYVSANDKLAEKKRKYNSPTY